MPAPLFPRSRPLAPSSLMTGFPWFDKRAAITEPPVLTSPSLFLSSRRMNNRFPFICLPSFVPRYFVVDLYRPSCAPRRGRFFLSFPFVCSALCLQSRRRSSCYPPSSRQVRPFFPSLLFSLLRISRPPSVGFSPPSYRSPS